jgi:hypothetical protein
MATGPICFSERIRSTPIPPHFRIAQGVEKYRGDAKPQTWLDDYRIAVQIGGGGDEIAMMHLPLMLEGSARTWLNQLPPNSIWIWEDLVRVFVKNFEGTYKRPGGLAELQLCTQKPAEPTREYIQRWITLHNSVEGVSEFQAIHAFKQGVRYKELSLKLARSPDVTSLGRMMEIANKYANGEEEIRQKTQQFRGGNNSSHPNPKNGGGGGKRKAEGAPTDAELVAAANAAGIHGKAQPRKGWQPRQKKPTSDDDILDQPCPLHTTRDAEGKTILPKHTARQCRLIKRAAQNAKTEAQQDKGKKKEGSPELDSEGFPQEDGVLVIFAGRETQRVEKIRFREVNTAAPAVPNYMKWSDVPITFDKSDHPPHIPHPGRHALIVDPLVETEKGNFRLRNVLMDGGSGINILYASTLKNMNIPMSKLSKSYLEFHGIIPGKKAHSMGMIALNVVFGSPNNFRKEKITFEVVDFPSAYHALLGRPAYAKFMAIPCYVYLKLKMPGPKGVITVSGNYKQAEELLQKGSLIADQQMAAVELAEYRKTADVAELLQPKKASSFESAGETKKVRIHPTDEEKFTNIATDLDPK